MQKFGDPPLAFEVTKHPHHDGGCYRTSPAILQPQQRQAAHTIVMLDREGSGAEDETADEIEADLEQRLAESGGGDRAGAVVVDPEIETWIWSSSPYVDEILGWSGRNPTLRDWLARNYLQPGQTKPDRPKEAFRSALRLGRIKPSAALFGELASKVGLEHCRDRGFLKLRDTLRAWFGAKPY